MIEALRSRLIFPDYSWYAGQRTLRAVALLVAALLLGLLAMPGAWAAPAPSGTVQAAASGNRVSAAQGCPGWSLMNSPSVPGVQTVLSAVSAASRDDIWAVGYTKSAAGVRTLTQHWDGREWKIVPSPNPRAGDNYLDGVVALSPNDAWAVGDSGSGTQLGSVLLHWDGTAWTPGKLPEAFETSGNSYSLYAISAVSPTDIWVAGVMGDPRFSHGMVLHYDGNVWGIHRITNIPSANSILYGIVARSATDVWAVGARQVPGSVQDLQVHWDGKTWEFEQVENRQAGLYMREAYDIDFGPNSNDRWIVGNSGSEASILHFGPGVAEKTGGHLRVLDRNYLRGVEAVSAREAWAVGHGETGQGADLQTKPLIAHTVNGSEWTALLGAPLEGNGVLMDITAIPGTNGELVAVGSHNGAPLIEMYRDQCAAPPPTATGLSAPVTPVVPTPSAPAAPTFAPTPIPGEGQGSRVFPETGKTVKGIFLEYWDKNGGLPQQGFPISEMFTEVSALDGKPYTVQYFERAVFEYHPEKHPPFNVLLSQLGTFRYKQKYPNGAPNQQANNSAGSVLFPETSKRVGGRFLEYWQKNGGLAQQGYPISEEFTEKSELDGKEYRVQYFERAVFEWHPENQPPYDVLLSQLGTFQYKQKYGSR